ncbi:PadR family transcriptional regulator, partial [Streptomyces virginiae]
MALDHAILVSLLEKPGSGYELARRFDRSIGYFWTATHQQIYRVLGRMEGNGLPRCPARPDGLRRRSGRRRPPRSPCTPWPPCR